MRILYDIGIRLYYLAAWIISPWNRKAKHWIAGRKHWYGPLREAFGEGEQVAWFHCASLGEFEQGRPLMEAFREQCSGVKILLTFFSPSGYNKRKNTPVADHVMYLPLDTARNARRMVFTLRPALAVFIKYEFWYHFLGQLRNQEVPVYLASGIFRQEQLFFRWYGRWYRNLLYKFTQIFVQQESSAALLKKFGIEQVVVSGDTRFDRVAKVAISSFHHPALEAFTRGRQVVIAGSTWDTDEQMLANACLQSSPDIRWIIAPHELSDAHLGRLQQRFPESARFTELGEEVPTTTRVVIVDTIGQLSFLYRYATLAYIGGGFGKGIHNILEAAAYGMPVMFGPRHEKFAEALELSALGGGFPVADQDEILSTINQLLNSDSRLKTTSEIARNYVLERTGATMTILDEVCTNG
jgi:3-deoxy-D-manno-octulosonic-acid transferase